MPQRLSSVKVVVFLFVPWSTVSLLWQRYVYSLIVWFALVVAGSLSLQLSQVFGLLRRRILLIFKRFEVFFGGADLLFDPLFTLLTSNPVCLFLDSLVLFLALKDCLAHSAPLAPREQIGHLLGHLCHFFG